MNAPHDPQSLVKYLKEHPTLDVRFPNKSTVYTYATFDGVRAQFVAPDNTIVSFPLTGFTEGSIHYGADGFERHVGNMIGHYYYRGPRPWKNVLQPEKKVAKTEREKQIEAWDEIFANLRL